jgi:hypothetical protein
VNAVGKGKYGGGYGGGGYEREGYKQQQQGSSETLEYGHTERRLGDKTEGNWASQLPNGSNMKVDYVVDAQPISKGYY